MPCLADNGKSTVSELTYTALGSYSHRLNTDIVQSMNPDRASIAAIHKKRNLVIEEPDQRRDINGSGLKEIASGTKWMSARRLYSNESKVRLECTIAILANQMPGFKPFDEAIKRRIRIFDFTSRFTKIESEVDAANHVYPVDPIIASVDFYADYGMQWLHLLRKYLLRIWNNGSVQLRLPQSMTSMINEYMKQRNIFMQVILEKFELTENSNDVIKLDKIVNHVKGSEFWENLTKKEKKGGCRTFVIDRIKMNENLKKRFHERKYVNKRSYRQCLVKCIEKPAQVDEVEYGAGASDQQALHEQNQASSNESNENDNSVELPVIDDNNQAIAEEEANISSDNRLIAARNHDGNNDAVSNEVDEAKQSNLVENINVIDEASHHTEDTDVFTGRREQVAHNNCNSNRNPFNNGDESGFASPPRKIQRTHY